MFEVTQRRLNLILVAHGLSMDEFPVLVGQGVVPVLQLRMAWLMSTPRSFLGPLEQLTLLIGRETHFLSLRVRKPGVLLIVSRLGFECPLVPGLDSGLGDRDHKQTIRGSVYRSRFTFSDGDGHGREVDGDAQSAGVIDRQERGRMVPRLVQEVKSESFSSEGAVRDLLYHLIGAAVSLPICEVKSFLRGLDF